MSKEIKRLAPAPLSKVTITTRAASDLIGIGPRWLQKLGQEDETMRVERGVWSLTAVVRAYIKTLKEEQKTGTKSDAANRKREAEAIRIETQNAIADGKLIEIDEAVAALEEIMGLVRSEITSLPARVTRDLALRGKIKKAIDDVLERSSECFAKAGRPIISGRSRQIYIKRF